MKQILSLLFAFSSLLAAAQAPVNKPGNTYVLVIHGGAGTILKSQMTPEREKAYQHSLNRALERGDSLLKSGASALDAVESVVRLLEDDSLFNAGKGAVFTHDGRNELDAAIMDGRTLSAGSVAGLHTVKNPISAARAVMEKSTHVLLTGEGAEQFVRTVGLETVDPSYFHTESRWRGLQHALRADSARMKLDHADSSKRSSLRQMENRDDKYGTVGAVALDRYGNLAAATSTGGMTNKRFGRVGDAPLIGAGTYADNRTAAISCTGWGEYFIRLVMAKSICDRMEFGKVKLADAAREMVMKRLPALGGDGGLIAVDRQGNIAMPFCTEGMYRGFIRSNGERQVRIYKEP